MKLAGNKALPGKGGRVIYQRPKRTNFLVAFPGADYEIEVYAPQPAIALAAAESKQLRPVPK